MSLQEPLTAVAPASDVEVGVTAPSKLSLLSRHARSIILSLSALSSLFIAAFSVVLYLYLSSPSSTPGALVNGDSAAKQFPFLTSGEPHPVGQAPFVPRFSALWRVGQDLDFSRNMSVDPCEDFYQYSCGGWIAAQNLTGRSMITKGFELAGIDNAVYVKEVIEADWPLVTPLFQSCMNTDAMQRLGLSPAKWFLDPLDPVKVQLTRDEAFYWMGQLRQQMRLTSIFSLTVGTNLTSPTQAVLNMGLGGTTFAPLAYYYGPSNITGQIRDGIAAMLTLAGDKASDAANYAARIVDFETGLIKVINRVAIAEEGREYTEEEWGLKVLADEKAANVDAQNNYYMLDELEALMPNTPIRAFFAGTRLPDVLQAAGVQGSVGAQLTAVGGNATYVALDAFLKDVDPVTLQLYTRWHALNVSAPYLTYQMRQTHFEHFNVEGVDQLPPNRYPQCSSLVMQLLPDLFGRYFMARRLPPEMRVQARDMITWIKQAFERNLPEVAWMDDTTRRVAAEKAYAVFELVGGPENGNWSDYSAITLRRDRYYDNWYSIVGLRVVEEWARLTTRTTRGAWPTGTNPSIVNAFYSPGQNAMIFPAGILVNPFYNGDLPMSMNLGAIGLVMGHELLHGFDNNGRQFDKDGQRRQWWDDNVITAFGRKTKCLIDQYNNIAVQGSKLNGQSCLGENIADNGGLHMAFLAYQWYKQQLSYYGYEDPLPPSKNPLTSDQLFYWAHAQTWCTKATDAAIVNQIRVDVHSPGEARVWAPVVNSAGFAAAYNCKVGSRMNPPLDRKCDLY